MWRRAGPGLIATSEAVGSRTPHRCCSYGGPGPTSSYGFDPFERHSPPPPPPSSSIPSPRFFRRFFRILLYFSPMTFDRRGFYLNGKTYVPVHLRSTIFKVIDSKIVLVRHRLVPGRYDFERTFRRDSSTTEGGLARIGTRINVIRRQRQFV